MTQPDSVLVTGATGFLGRAVANGLECQYRCLRGVRRAPSGSADTRYVNYGDLALPSFGQDLSLSGINVVVHCAGSAHRQPNSDTERAIFEAVNVNATERLAQLARRDGVRHFILLSSIGVLGSPDDATILSDQSTALPTEPYAQTKYDGERAVTRVLDDSLVAYTILRPTMIFGHGNPGNPGLLQRLIRKAPVIPLGGVHNRRSFIYVENLVGLIKAIIVARPANNSTHVVADPWVVSTADFVAELAKRNTPPKKVINVSPRLLRLGARLLGRPQLADKLLGSLEVDAAAVWSRFHTTPIYTWEQSFDRMFDLD